MAERDIINQRPIMMRALKEALAEMPQGTRARDISSSVADFTLEFDFITEYDPSLAGGQRPTAWSRGSWNAFLSLGDAADEVHKTAREHLALLDDVYAGKYSGAA